MSGFFQTVGVITGVLTLVIALSVGMLGLLYKALRDQIIDLRAEASKNHDELTRELREIKREIAMVQSSPQEKSAQWGRLRHMLGGANEPLEERLKAIEDLLWRLDNDRQRR